jgi:hypothetical protein
VKTFQECTEKLALLVQKHYELVTKGLTLLALFVCTSVVLLIVWILLIFMIVGLFG